MSYFRNVDIGYLEEFSDVVSSLVNNIFSVEGRYFKYPWRKIHKLYYPNQIKPIKSDLVIVFLYDALLYLI